jgi:hypothetical protein
MPVGVPTMTAPPGVAPTATDVRTPTLAAVPPKPVAPDHLPVSVTDDAGWHKTDRPGTDAWAPVGGRPPAVPPTDPAWQPGATNTAAGQPVARAQAPQASRPDPVVALVKTLCQNRATDVEVRYTGTKKLSVCFEVRGEAAGNALVKEIGNRQELVPYQIDFCVVVK